ANYKTEVLKAVAVDIAHDGGFESRAVGRREDKFERPRFKKAGNVAGVIGDHQLPFSVRIHAIEVGELTDRLETSGVRSVGILREDSRLIVEDGGANRGAERRSFQIPLIEERNLLSAGP